MTPNFYFTDVYRVELNRIEKFISENLDNDRILEKFVSEHDKILEFVGSNPKAAAVHPATGDQSWVFGNGRYRIFFKTVSNKNSLHIYLLHIIDNREANLEVYPNNTLPTYDED